MKITSKKFKAITAIGLLLGLKKCAGAGGTARGNEIEIQGNHLRLVTAELSRVSAPNAHLSPT